jgi:hypothetical protein
MHGHHNYSKGKSGFQIKVFIIVNYADVATGLERFSSRRATDTCRHLPCMRTLTVSGGISVISPRGAYMPLSEQEGKMWVVRRTSGVTQRRRCLAATRLVRVVLVHDLGSLLLERLYVDLGRLDLPASNGLLELVLDLLRGPRLDNGSEAEGDSPGLELTHSGVRALVVDLHLEVEVLGLICGHTLAV